MDVLLLIGRILFVFLFLGSAVGHLTQAGAMSGYAKSRGVPAPWYAVIVSGVVILLGGLSVLLGLWADLGALLLLLFLIGTALLMHPFWRESEAQARQQEMIQFNKDIALAGAALMLFAYVAGTGEIGPALTGPLFSLA